MISRIYHSREDRIADLHKEDERIQYDERDPDRIEDLIGCVDDYAGELSDKLEEYYTLANSADTEEDDLDYARREIIEKWSLAQAALSKTAFVLRFDGNKAYERMINALKTGAAVDMRGL